MSAPRIAGIPRGSPGHRNGMEIPKEQILKLLRERGQDDKVAEADQQLPDRSTPSSTRICSASSASTPQELLGGGLGGLGDKLGL